MLDIQSFQKIIWDYYRDNKRYFMWRELTDPYHIVVSEVMLQQTQTHRVAQKFEPFINAFPTFHDLAKASLRDVVLQWQGLGYNRRALALHKIAQKVMSGFGGQLPNNPEILETFPGIGPNTAGSVCAFAFNKPTVFIETNIRSVFIFFFFKNRTEVTDKELLPLVAAAVDRDNPREWYYALMDYGVMLKSQLPNPSRRSAHHAVQSKFEGSERQVRSMILKTVALHGTLTHAQLLDLINKEPERIEKNLIALCKEGFLKKMSEIITLSDDHSL